MVANTFIICTEPETSQLICDALLARRVEREVIINCAEGLEMAK